MQLPAAISVQAGHWPQGSPGFASVAVQGLGEDAGRRGLSAAARPGEEERVGDTSALQRVEESARDVVLPDEFMEVLGAPLARQDLVLHSGKSRAPGDLRHI